MAVQISENCHAGKGQGAYRTKILKQVKQIDNDGRPEVQLFVLWKFLDQFTPSNGRDSGIFAKHRLPYAFEETKQIMSVGIQPVMGLFF